MGRYVLNGRTNELYHHGIKGQRWGVRRYQNEDGSLKSANRKNDTNNNRNVIKKTSVDKKKIAKSIAVGLGTVGVTAATVAAGKAFIEGVLTLAVPYTIVETIRENL